MRNITAIGLVRRALREANEALTIAHAALAHKDGEIALLNARLLEARRHTLPMGVVGGMESEINFLPLAVLRYEMKHDTYEIHSHHFGFREQVEGQAKFELTVLAVVDGRDSPVIFQRGQKKP